MKKAILALFMTVAFVSAFSVKGNTHPTTSKGLFQFVDTSCSGAVAGFNKGIKQLIHNIQTQSNQWLVYSDLDALDGFAYHLQNLCNPEDLELTTKLEGGQTPEQQQACSNLLAMIGSLLDQNQPQTFKSGYEQGLAWSQQALGFGPNIADGCKIWVEVNAETQAEEEYDAEEEWGSGEENNEDAVLDWNLNILAQKKSHEDCDSDDAQNASDNSEADSDNSGDQDSKDDSEDDDSDADSDEDSDDNNEEWTTKAWDSEEEWATKAWDTEEEWTTKAWAHEESTLKAWDNDEEWTTKALQSEEWALKGWDNGDWSDWKSGDQEWQTPQSDSSDQPTLSTFFYEVNPNGNTDSGNDWMNGGYQRYIPGGSGANPGSGGNAGIPSIPSIPGNPGGAKLTFLANVGQQASGNPWMDGDYKRYYGGNDGGAPTTTFLAVKKEKKDSDDSDNGNDNPWASDYKKYYDGNGGNDGPKQGNFFYWTI